MASATRREQREKLRLRFATGIRLQRAAFPAPLLFLCLYMCVCSATLSSVLARDAQAAPPEPLQGAILIVLDTLRADRLSAYGHHRNTSPNIDRLAEHGVLFEQVISSAPWTLPSLASMFSARWLAESFDPSLPNQYLRDSVVESIASAGYATAAFTEGGYFSKHFGFDRGFSKHREEEGAVTLKLRGKAADKPSSPSNGSIGSTFGAAQEWLRENASKKFFMLVHTYEVHTPYRRHHFTADFDQGDIGPSLEIPALRKVRRGKLANRDQERGYVRALYDSGVHEADRYVARLLAELTSLGIRERTLIVITSDHGEELGDHYPLELARHGHALKDDQLRVPLIISNPTRQYPVSRVPQAVRTIDILPTIAEMLKVPLAHSVDGRSLVLFMLGADTRDRVAYGGAVDYGPRRAFVRTSNFKLIEIAGAGSSDLKPRPERVQLYDLKLDPGETNNIARSRPDVAERLSKMLREHQRGSTERVHESAVPRELEERLRSLGYIE